ncbi:MAG: hypothetical protein HGA45_13755 [Chloroflexales bacterium]|nr:hypothetical protein [Chloroflexales bacterium]
MITTIVGLFDTFGEAQTAVEDLMHFGIRREHISLVTRDEHGDTSRERAIGSSGAAEGAGAGAVGGSLVGGAIGLLIGMGLLVIPGIGPVLAAGPLAAAIGSTAAAVGATALGAGLGAAAGGLLGSLMGVGIPEEEAELYVEGVRRGNVLISVGVADPDTADVRQILARNGAIDIQSRAAEWRAAGWDAAGSPKSDDDRDRKPVDTSYSTVDRTGERVKGAEGFASGHDQPYDADPAQFSEFAADNQNTRAQQATDRRPPAGQARQPGGAQIYDRPSSQAQAETARAEHTDELPAHGDFARGLRQEPSAPVEPDYARGMHTGPSETGRSGQPDTPHHGDFARGLRQEETEPLTPDYARGQRGHEEYDADFLAHYQAMMGSGGQPYDYYKPGYQFGYDMATDTSYQHDTWPAAERDARQRWEHEARGSWEEFKQAIRYGWEKARGRA